MIYYKSGYKYQLDTSYSVITSIMPKECIDTEFIKLYPNGTLLIRKDYAWDGPSGPTVDTKNFMRGSLTHDALYQIIRQGYLPRASRLQADLELKRICLEDGMSKIRAWWVYHGVRLGGGPAANPKNVKKVQTAP